MTLARIDKAGGDVNQYGSVELFMDGMEQTGIVKTSSANSLVTDSAPASSAMATGEKTNNGRCYQPKFAAIQGKRDGENLTTILEMAEESGLSTGLITTTRITHATPAAFYAHVDNRDNESEIADQLLASGVEVILEEVCSTSQERMTLIPWAIMEREATRETFSMNSSRKVMLWSIMDRASRR